LHSSELLKRDRKNFDHLIARALKKLQRSSESPAFPGTVAGIRLALLEDMKEKIREPEQLRSWQAAHQFKLEVYRLLDDSAAALRDFRFRDQLRDAASDIESDIGEGFKRFYPSVICQFLTYALSSLEEAVTRVHDGITRGYFPAKDAQLSLQLGQDCERYVTNWWKSLQPYIKKKTDRPRHRPQKRRRPREDKDSSGL